MPGNADPTLPPDLPVDPFDPPGMGVPPPPGEEPPGSDPVPPGQVPLAVDDNDPPLFGTNEDEPLLSLGGFTFATSLLDNDSDPNDDNLSVTAINGDTQIVGVEIDVMSEGGRYAKLFVDDVGNVKLRDPLSAFNSLGDGASDTIIFTYTISDGRFFNTATATLTIQGSNDEPTIDGVFTGHVTEDTGLDLPLLRTSGMLTIVDPDLDESKFTAQSETVGSNGFGTFTLTEGGTWIYEANNEQAAIQALGAGQSLTDSFTAWSLDQSESQIVTVTIHGFDDFVTLEDPTPTDDDHFGASLDSDGNFVLIGAPGDDTQGNGLGQAHLINVNTGQLLYTFDQAGAFAFGTSVAIDGTNVVIGAPGAETTFLFDANTHQVLQTFLNPPGTVQDSFGEEVAIDGNYIVVGAPDDDYGTVSQPIPNVGTVYLYDLTSAQPDQPVWTFFNPTPQTGDVFGHAVAISGDYVVIGAFGEDTAEGNNVGIAYLYDVNNPAQPLLTLLNPRPDDGDLFGAAVAIDGNYVIIGAQRDDTQGSSVGAAYLYDLTSAQPDQPVWTFDDPTPTPRANGDGDRFGFSVDIKGDTILIGARLNGDQGGDGQVHLYDTTGDLLHTFDAPLEGANSGSGGFGSDVAINGNQVLASADAFTPTFGSNQIGQAYLIDADPFLIA